MAQVRGFQDVMNGNANGAGIVLPDSQTENYAIDEIAKNGLLAQRQQAAQKQAAAQANKDFATNQLNIHPGVLYNGEINGLAQKWFDTGVQYRRQGINPFNVDWNDPKQAQIAAQYLGDKHKIEQLAALRDSLSKDYSDKQKLSQEGKYDGFEDYDKFIKTHTLQQIQEAGGLDSVPQLSPRYDTAKVDSQIKGHIVPQHDYQDVPVPGMPGVVSQQDSEYIDGKQARMIAENGINNTNGSKNMFQKIGVGDTNQLYTKGGHYMTFDPNDKSDLGQIDQPAIAHQMATDYLTKPDLIKQLPDEVKQNILNSKNAVKLFNGGQMDMTKVGDAVMGKPYDAAEDPAFKKFLMQKVGDQLKKEADYNAHIYDAVSRNTPELKDSQKYDSTKANWEYKKQQLYLSQRRLADAEAKTAGENNPGYAPVDMNIPYLGGKANVNASNYVPISVPNKNFAGVPAYSLTGGKPVKALESSGDYSVVGVGNFPFVNNKYKNAGTIAQPGFSEKNPDGVDQKPMVHVQKKDSEGSLEDFLIPYDKLPENIKNSKPVKQALSKFRPASAQSPAQVPVQQKSKKTTDLSNIFGGN